MNTHSLPNDAKKWDTRHECRLHQKITNLLEETTETDLCTTERTASIVKKWRLSWNIGARRNDTDGLPHWFRKWSPFTWSSTTVIQRCRSRTLPHPGLWSISADLESHSNLIKKWFLFLSHEIVAWYRNLATIGAWKDHGNDILKIILIREYNLPKIIILDETSVRHEDSQYRVPSFVNVIIFCSFVILTHSLRVVSVRLKFSCWISILSEKIVSWSLSIVFFFFGEGEILAICHYAINKSQSQTSHLELFEFTRDIFPNKIWSVTIDNEKRFVCVSGFVMCYLFFILEIVCCCIVFAVFLNGFRAFCSKTSDELFTCLFFWSFLFVFFLVC